MFRINRLLSYQIKSIPIVENPLSHFTLRVAHQVSRTSRHSVPTLVSFHQTLVENPPCLSLEPDTCSSRPPCTRLANSMGEISLFPSISRVASRKPRIDASLLDYYSIPNGCCWQRGGESFFFFWVSRSGRVGGCARRRRWLGESARKSKRRAFNERARDGVADRPRLNRADSGHVGLEWAWLSDGDGRSGWERDGRCSAGGWSGLAKWG